MIFAVFLYTLTGPKETAYLAGIPLAAFAFFHISIYVFMPILVIVLLMMYMLDGNRGWLVSLLVTLAGYLLSAFWSFSIAPYYSYGNYSVLWKLTRNLINEKNIQVVIVVLCGILAALALFLMSGRGEAFAGCIRKGLSEVRGGRVLLGYVCRWQDRYCFLYIRGLFRESISGIASICRSAHIST